MAKNKVIFTCDWEMWNSFDHHSKWDKNESIDEPTNYLLDLLRRHDIKAIFYCVGWLKDNRPDLFKTIQFEGHKLGDHTYFHKGLPTFKPGRSPRWKGEKRLFSGGFWFRLIPYWWIKREIEKTGIFFIHPHDVLLDHPDFGKRNFDRNIGLKTSSDNLERLVRELVWDEPR
mgnify:CR=1 FL=1